MHNAWKMMQCMWAWVSCEMCVSHVQCVNWRALDSIVFEICLKLQCWGSLVQVHTKLLSNSWPILTLINSTNPQSAVHSHPLTPSQSLLLMLAPFSAKYFTVSRWPPSAARCRGVSWWGGVIHECPVSPVIHAHIPECGERTLSEYMH